MNRHNFSIAKTFTLLLLSTILPSLLNLPPISCAPIQPYIKCGALFNCGDFTGISFPFWGGERPAECGHPGLKLGCENGTTTIDINNVKYRVLDINQQTQLLKIARDDLSQSLCPQQLTNTTLDSKLFEHAFGYVNLTFLYGCPAVGFKVPFQFECAMKGITEKIGYVEFGTLLSGLCHSIVVVPVSYTSFLDFNGLKKLIGEGFEVRFKVDSGGCGECEKSGGRCGYGVAGKFVCFCSDQKAAESNACAAGAVGAAGNHGHRLPTLADAGNRGPRASVVAPSPSGTHALVLFVNHLFDQKTV